MIRDRLFQPAALLLLAIILGAMALIWPLPNLGFDADISTGGVLEVLPGTTAFDAGMLPGDRITHIYGYPWEQVNTRLLLLPLPWREGTPTPVVIEREGCTFNLVLIAGAPSLPLQAERVIRGLIALICWATGFLLGTSPRATDVRLRRTGWFWALLGGSLGLYVLTKNASYIITVGVVWFQCTVLAPFSVAMQFWYPLRPGSGALQQRMWRYLFITLGVIQAIGIPLLLALPTTAIRFEILHDAVRMIFLVSFGLSGLVLWRAYATTDVAHIRRQIRLIGAACMLTFIWALVLLLLQIAAPTLAHLVPPATFPLGV